MNRALRGLICQPAYCVTCARNRFCDRIVHHAAPLPEGMPICLLCPLIRRTNCLERFAVRFSICLVTRNPTSIRMICRSSKHTGRSLNPETYRKPAVKVKSRRYRSSGLASRHKVACSSVHKRQAQNESLAILKLFRY